MTFVTLIQEAWMREDGSIQARTAKRETVVEEKHQQLFCRVPFGFECFQVADSQAASVYFHHSFRLEAGKITGNELADCANL
jgi:hypothetical protein